MTAGAVLRSALFALVQIVTVPPFALLALATFPCAPLTRYRIITAWSRLIVQAAERICGIRYRVLGAESIPRAASREQRKPPVRFTAITLFHSSSGMSTSS